MSAEGGKVWCPLAAPHFLHLPLQCVSISTYLQQLHVGAAGQGGGWGLGKLQVTTDFSLCILPPPLPLEIRQCL